MKNATFPQVSFIIPTLNAANILPRCLEAIRSQNYPQSKVEIIIADGGSKDETVHIGKKFGAKVVANPEVLHEPGKSRASKFAAGDIIFYTDADNILSTKNWLTLMVKPYLDNPKIMGYLPQTIPAPDSNPVDRYLGHLCTDPFTWFVYKNAARPEDYAKLYQPVKKTADYSLYQFRAPDFPLFGLSQGVGTSKYFKRTGIAHADDLLAGIKLMEEGGLVAVIPQAGVYHYHVDGFAHFLQKYTWRIRNNLQQKIKGMGLVNRLQFFSWDRKIRMIFFVPYALSIVFPLLDAIWLSIRFNDPIMFWHIPCCFILAVIMMIEYVRNLLHIKPILKNYS